MKKNRTNIRIFFISFISSLAISGSVFFYQNFWPKDLTIVVENLTSIKIENLALVLKNTNQVITLPEVKEDSELVFKIDSSTNFEDDSLFLRYYDKCGNMHEECLYKYFIEYFLKKEKAKITIHIYEIDKNEKLKLSISYSIK